MIKIKYIVISIVAIVWMMFVPAVAKAQTLDWLQNTTVNPFPFVKLLPSNTVNCVYQDRLGIIWIGTKDGVCRYDGYRLDVLRSNITNVKLLSDNDVIAIAENDSYYFFGTRRGVSAMDKLTHFVFPLNLQPLKQVEARSMQVDGQGNLWVGTKETLYKVSADLASCTSALKSGLPKSSVSNVYIDADGTIWASLWEHGLWQLTKHAAKWRKMPRIGATDNPFCLLPVGDGDFWISTWANGCYRLNEMAKGKYEVEEAQDDYSANNPLNTVYGMAQTQHPDLIWTVGTAGLKVASNQGGKLHVVDISMVEQQMDKPFNNVFVDRAGGIWVSAVNDGIYLLSTFAKPWSEFTMSHIFERYGFRTDIQALYVDQSANLWMAQTGCGLGMRLPSGETVFYREMPSLRTYDKLIDIAFIGAIPSAGNQVWVAPKYEAAIYQISYASGSVSLAGKLELNACKGGFVNYIFEDSRHNIWLPTTKGILVKPSDGKVQNLRIGENDVCAVSESPDGKIWFASQSKGVMVLAYGMQAGKVVVKETLSINKDNSPLSTDNMEGVCYNAHNRKMWMVTREGSIVAYDMASKQFENHSQAFEGYVNSAVQNLLTDNLGHLWVSTSRNLLRYDADDESMSIYSADDGLSVLMFAKNSCTLSPDGKNIYFGGNGGVVSIDPARPIYPLESKSLPIVTDIRIGKVSMYSGMLDEEYKLENGNHRISLAADAQDIEIDFSSGNYLNPSKIVFAYKLEGVDDNWRYTTPNQAYAFYNHLSKGKHTLMVRVTDANGKWSKETVTYEIYRLPAFYETWWAYLIYIVAIVAIIYYVVKRMRRRMEEREELRMERMKRKSEEELTQSKLRYFTNVSHDFLTPITLISCIIDDLQMTTENQSSYTKLAFGHIRVNLMKLKQLIQQVLDFRKMERGGMHLEVSEGDLLNFVKGLSINYFEPLMQKKQLAFHFVCELTSLKAWFDGDKLEKILSNLLSNAIKYTDKGSITVSLKRDGDVAVVEVKDTGKGIDAKDLPHIFNRFYTVNEQRSDSNGIGLSLVKELVELHHASISVNSEVGVGSVFTLVVPINREHYADSELKEYKTEAERLELQLPQENLNVELDTTQADDKKMLIVEDNEELRNLMVRIFSRYHQVVYAADGVEGLQKANEENPDLIISDVMMPRMDGLEMCRKLKGDINTSHIPLILLTARNTSDDCVECYEAGADGYIAKPFELKVLKAHIDNYLKQKHEHQQAFQHESPVAKEGKITQNDGMESLEMSPIDKKLLDKAIAQIEEHLGDDSFDIDTFASAMCMSKSSLYRKVKAITGLSPVEFVRNIRLKRAYKMLLEGDKSITEVAYDCGFTTPRYFSTCFKTEFGISPTEVRKQL